jgi:hypothetical protein
VLPHWNLNLPARTQAHEIIGDDMRKENSKLPAKTTFVGTGPGIPEPRLSISLIDLERAVAVLTWLRLRALGEVE